VTSPHRTELTRGWRKSSHSTGGNDCVEVAQTRGGYLVRDSKNPDGPRLALTPQEWAVFIRAIKNSASNG
jgi:Domain of unknown function (DUF397)